MYGLLHIMDCLCPLLVVQNLEHPNIMVFHYEHLKAPSSPHNMVTLWVSLSSFVETYTRDKVGPHWTISCQCFIVYESYTFVYHKSFRSSSSKSLQGTKTKQNKTLFCLGHSIKDTPSDLMPKCHHGSYRTQEKLERSTTTPLLTVHALSIYCLGPPLMDCWQAW